MASAICATRWRSTREFTKPRTATVPLGCETTSSSGNAATVLRTAAGSTCAPGTGAPRCVSVAAAQPAPTSSTVAARPSAAIRARPWRRAASPSPCPSACRSARRPDSAHANRVSVASVAAGCARSSSTSSEPMVRMSPPASANTRCVVGRPLISTAASPTRSAETATSPTLSTRWRGCTSAPGTLMSTSPAAPSTFSPRRSVTSRP
ncbi:hypothetical protein D3C81_1272580 [compost metagenome]